MPNANLANDRDRDVERLEELQNEMMEALQEFESICKKYKSAGLPLDNYKAYVFDHLRIGLADGHEFLTRDRNLTNIIEAVQDLDLDSPDEESDEN